MDSLSDPELLDRTALEDRVLVSHDRRTMLNHFRNHLAAGKSSPGLLVVAQDAPTGIVAEAIRCSLGGLMAWRTDESGLSSFPAHLSQLFTLSPLLGGGLADRPVAQVLILQQVQQASHVVASHLPFPVGYWTERDLGTITDHDRTSTAKMKIGSRVL